MGRLLLKPGVKLGTNFSPALARLLEVLKSLVRSYAFDVTITSVWDGAHKPGSAHYTGEAFDLRTKDLTTEQKRLLLHDLQNGLYGEPRRFYVVLEDQGGHNEHIHGQRRAGTVYTVETYLNDN